MFLDVRTDEQYNICNLSKNISNYLHIPLEELQKLESNDLNEKLVNTSNIYVLCRSGNKSTFAVDYLLKHGYSNVFNVEGGIHAYINDVDDSIPYY